ncbi:hypothetical protein ILUMI_00887 [Ignelater luminosus]|uniref:DNA topoisomerase (ATP-hydrolyzing) n=1 Tax=Ignelater luminosus TaxID=2038154 RepID=A0A8K0GPS4_IGNLU|nr:hypothetical protein ILUMI_00887 [Ignelater luminosus]
MLQQFLGVVNIVGELRQEVISKRRKKIGLPEKYLYTKDTKSIYYVDFVNRELILSSNADNVRSIPSLVDGVEPGQRKVLFTCIKRNDKKEVKVAQLSGSVAEHLAYHHGEVCLCTTIVSLAQLARLAGGKDYASPRYIFTKMSPLTRLIFHPSDDSLLKHEYDDNQKIEPVWYIPIIPMILVNGADGIGTGWMTKIPNYNPRETVQNLRIMLDGDDELVPMIPWYKNFRGTIEDCGNQQRYVISGEIAIIGNDKVEITELSIGTWTQNYKENVLEPLLHDITVKFVVTCKPGLLVKLKKDSLHKVLKLQSVTHTTSMCAFDELGCLRTFESVIDILQEFYTLLLKMYEKRKDYLEGFLEAEAAQLCNQARFIVEKCSRDLVVENKKRKTIAD